MSGRTRIHAFVTSIVSRSTIDLHVLASGISIWETALEAIRILTSSMWVAEWHTSEWLRSQNFVVALARLLMQASSNGSH